MGTQLRNVKEIEHAIESLGVEELAELYRWLDQRDPESIDERLRAGLEAGHFDAAISRALEDEKSGRDRPL